MDLDSIQYGTQGVADVVEAAGGLSLAQLWEYLIGTAGGSYLAGWVSALLFMWRRRIAKAAKALEGAE